MRICVDLCFHVDVMYCRESCKRVSLEALTNAPLQIVRAEAILLFCLFSEIVINSFFGILTNREAMYVGCIGTVLPIISSCGYYFYICHDVESYVAVFIFQNDAFCLFVSLLHFSFALGGALPGAPARLPL